MDFDGVSYVDFDGVSYSASDGVCVLAAFVLGSDGRGGSASFIAFAHWLWPSLVFLFAGVIGES